ncbi:MAG: DUF2116 family Zn-ribbon domain-containing protein [Bacteroidales bacterium]|nr:DUF2116 family Zn-ribbon domain-containing protein [Bacteroidales bacterium]
MERRCIRCGAPLRGRADRKFCSDACRTDYHNERRRQEEKALREVNRILASNWKILSAQIRQGRTRLPGAELAALQFNFGVYTATQWRFPRRLYWCYNCTWCITRRGIVRIGESVCRNNAYLYTPNSSDYASDPTQSAPDAVPASLRRTGLPGHLRR